jgi:hypothetical protein
MEYRVKLLKNYNNKPYRYPQAQVALAVVMIGSINKNVVVSSPT